MEHTSVCIRKPKKKKQKKVKEDPMVKASGPSNAEEAQHMRSVLGFASTPPATPSAINITPLAQPAQPQNVPQTVAQPQQVQPQLQQPQQPLQAQTEQLQQPAAQSVQPLAQQPPIQPQQQATFRFGFAGEQPAAPTPVATSTLPAAAPQAPSQAASQKAVPAAGAEQALPAPPAEPEYVARRVFVGGMPFSYEVSKSVLHLHSVKNMVTNDLACVYEFLRLQSSTSPVHSHCTAAYQTLRACWCLYTTHALVS